MTEAQHDTDQPDRAIEARAKRTFTQQLDETLHRVRRSAGPDRFRWLAIVMDQEAFHQLRYEVHPGLNGFGTYPLLTADGEYRGFPIERVRDHIGVGVVLPGEAGWPLFVAAQGRRLAGLALERFEPGASKGLVLKGSDTKAEHLEAAMLKIAERIAWA